MEILNLSHIRAHRKQHCICEKHCHELSLKSYFHLPWLHGAALVCAPPPPSASYPVWWPSVMGVNIARWERKPPICTSSSDGAPILSS